jgi:hypothetical protein
MKRLLRVAAVVAGCGSFMALLLGATDVALVIAAALVCGAWVWLVLLDDGERELRRFEQSWAPLLERRDDRDALASGLRLSPDERLEPFEVVPRVDVHQHGGVEWHDPDRECRKRITKCELAAGEAPL